MCMSALLYMYMCVPSAHQGQKTVLDALEL